MLFSNGFLLRSERLSHFLARGGTSAAVHDRLLSSFCLSVWYIRCCVPTYRQIQRKQMWSMYMQLTEAEASFRALKSELSIRPLFHQKEPRVKAHVLVAFLGYALWVTLKHLLQRQPVIAPQPSADGVDNPQPFSPMKALALLSTLQSADIVLPTTDGREI